MKTGQNTRNINTRPYFDQIHATNSEDESDLEFIRPDQDWDPAAHSDSH